MTLKATVYGNIVAEYSAAADMGGVSFSTDPKQPNIFHTFSDGTADYKADRAFFDTRTLALSANEDLDLSAALSGPAGSAAVFAKVKTIMVRAAAANTNNVIIKPGATNGFLGPFGAATHTLSVKPGALLLLVEPKAGWTVTAGTGDIINVANSAAGTPVTYDIMILGTSA